MKRNCFICTSPYNVFCSLAVIATLGHDYGECYDIYIEDCFNNAREVSERIVKYSDVSSVFLISPADTKCNIIHYIKRYSYYLNPKFYFKRNIMFCVSKQKRKENFLYDNFFVAARTATSIYLRILNPKASLYLYEDGFGSYIGSLSKQNLYTSFSMKVACFLTGKCSIKWDPKASYLFRPELCKMQMTCEKRKIKDINLQMVELYEKVFGKISGLNSRIYYLAQSKTDGKVYADLNELIFKSLEKYKKYTIVRPHPRDRGIVLCGFEIDSSEEMWELKCAKSVDEGSILIGAFSSAQITPYLLYEKYPFIIFTYELSRELKKKCYDDGVSDFIKDMSVIYKKKIFVPKTIDEFERNLKYIFDIGREE